MALLNTSDRAMNSGQIKRGESSHRKEVIGQNGFFFC